MSDEIDRYDESNEMGRWRRKKLDEIFDRIVEDIENEEPSVLERLEQERDDLQTKVRKESALRNWLVSNRFIPEKRLRELPTFFLDLNPPEKPAKKSAQILKLDLAKKSFRSWKPDDPREQRLKAQLHNVRWQLWLIWRRGINADSVKQSIIRKQIYGLEAALVELLATRSGH